MGNNKPTKKAVKNYKDIDIPFIFGETISATYV